MLIFESSQNKIKLLLTQFFLFIFHAYSIAGNVCFFEKQYNLVNIMVVIKVL